MSILSSCSSISLVKGEIIADLSGWCLDGINEDAKFVDRNIASERILNAYLQRGVRLDLSDLQIGPRLPSALQHLSNLKFFYLANTDVIELPPLPQECEIVMEGERGMSESVLSQREQEAPIRKCRRWLEQAKELDSFELFQDIESSGDSVCQ